MIHSETEILRTWIGKSYITEDNKVFPLLSHPVVDLCWSSGLIGLHSGGLLDPFSFSDLPGLATKWLHFHGVHSCLLEYLGYMDPKIYLGYMDPKIIFFNDFSISSA